MPEKLDPRILPILEQTQQLEQRRRPKQPFSREKFQEVAEEQQQVIKNRKRDVSSKQKGQKLEAVDQDLVDSGHQFQSPKTTLNGPIHFAPPHTLEVAKVSIAGTAPQPAGPPSMNKGLPSLYQCAEQLKKKVHLIFHLNSLYGYNGICYDFLYPKDVIRLYRNRVDNQLGGERSLGSIRQLHEYLCTDDSILVNESEDNQRIAVLKNGVFDVETGKLRGHSDKTIVFSYVKANYVDRGKCKYFHRFLECITHGDKVLQERFWQFLGYMLLQTNEAKAFFIMGTAPNSGKSVLGNFIESLFDSRYASSIALNDLNKNFSLAPLAGSAVNISLDLPATKLKPSAVSLLKMLTGGDTVEIEQKYMAKFNYRNRAKLLFASNFPIELYEDDDAFWQRMVYLPFDYSIPKSNQNTDLLKLLQEEQDAVVSEALRHAKTLIESNFCFPSTYMIDRRMQEWQGRTNPSIENFLKDCCLIDESYRGELTETLFSAYQQYCDSTGLVAKNRPFFKQFLENEIDLEHFKMRDGGENPQSAFRNIKLKGGSMS